MWFPELMKRKHEYDRKWHKIRRKMEQKFGQPNFSLMEGRHRNLFTSNEFVTIYTLVFEMAHEKLRATYNRIERSMNDFMEMYTVPKIQTMVKAIRGLQSQARNNKDDESLRLMLLALNHLLWRSYRDFKCMRNWMLRFLSETHFNDHSSAYRGAPSIRQAMANAFRRHVLDPFRSIFAMSFCDLLHFGACAEYNNDFWAMSSDCMTDTLGEQSKLSQMTQNAANPRKRKPKLLEPHALLVKIAQMYCDVDEFENVEELNDWKLMLLWLKARPLSYYCNRQPSQNLNSPSNSCPFVLRGVSLDVAMAKKIKETIGDSLISVSSIELYRCSLLPVDQGTDKGMHSPTSTSESIQSIKHIASWVTTSRHFNFSNCENLTDEWLEMWADSVKAQYYHDKTRMLVKVRNLCFRHNKNLTSRSIPTLAGLADLLGLESLDLHSKQLFPEIPGSTMSCEKATDMFNCLSCTFGSARLTLNTHAPTRIPERSAARRALNRRNPIPERGVARRALNRRIPIPERDVPRRTSNTSIPETGAALRTSNTPIPNICVEPANLPVLVLRTVGPLRKSHVTSDPRTTRWAILQYRLDKNVQQVLGLVKITRTLSTVTNNETATINEKWTMEFRSENFSSEAWYRISGSLLAMIFRNESINPPMKFLGFTIDHELLDSIDEEHDGMNAASSVETPLRLSTSNPSHIRDLDVVAYSVHGMGAGFATLMRACPNLESFYTNQVSRPATRNTARPQIRLEDFMHALENYGSHLRILSMFGVDLNPDDTSKLLGTFGRLPSTLEQLDLTRLISTNEKSETEMITDKEWETLAEALASRMDRPVTVTGVSTGRRLLVWALWYIKNGIGCKPRPIASAGPSLPLLISTSEQEDHLLEVLEELSADLTAVFTFVRNSDILAQAFPIGKYCRHS